MGPRYFIGLQFDQDDFWAKKIKKFKSQFEIEVDKNPLSLAIIPPFDLENLELQSFIEESQELGSDFFSGINQECSLLFRKSDVFQKSRKSLFYLCPELTSELSYYQENLIHVAKEFKGLKFKTDSTFSPYFHVGSFYMMSDLHFAIEKFTAEFSLPFSMKVQNLGLFEKLGGRWKLRQEFFRFSHKNLGQLILNWHTL